MNGPSDIIRNYTHPLPTWDILYCWKLLRLSLLTSHFHFIKSYTWDRTEEKKLEILSGVRAVRYTIPQRLASLVLRTVCSSSTLRVDCLAYKYISLGLVLIKLERYKFRKSCVSVISTCHSSLLLGGEEQVIGKIARIGDNTSSSHLWTN